MKPSVGTWLLPPQPWKPSVPAAPEETAVAEIASIAVPQTSKPWQFAASVGTWMMPLPLKVAAAPASVTTLSNEDEVELDIRQSAFDLFWQQFDEQEAEEA